MASGAMAPTPSAAGAEVRPEDVLPEDISHKIADAVSSYSEWRKLSHPESEDDIEKVSAMMMKDFMKADGAAGSELEPQLHVLPEEIAKKITDAFRSFREWLKRSHPKSDGDKVSSMLNRYMKDAMLKSQIIVQATMDTADKAAPLIAAERFAGRVWETACRSRESCGELEDTMWSSTTQEAELLLSELRGRVCAASRHVNAYSFLKEGIMQLPFACCSFVVEEIGQSRRLEQLAKHRFGCQVVSALIVWFSAEDEVQVMCDELVATRPSTGGQQEPLNCVARLADLKSRRTNHGSRVLARIVEQGSAEQKHAICRGLMMGPQPGADGYSQQARLPGVLGYAMIEGGCELVASALDHCAEADIGALQENLRLGLRVLARSGEERRAFDVIDDLRAGTFTRRVEEWLGVLSVELREVAGGPGGDAAQSLLTEAVHAVAQAIFDRGVDSGALARFLWALGAHSEAVRLVLQPRGWAAQFGGPMDRYALLRDLQAMLWWTIWAQQAGARAATAGGAAAPPAM